MTDRRHGMSEIATRGSSKPSTWQAPPITGCKEAQVPAAALLVRHTHLLALCPELSKGFLQNSWAITAKLHCRLLRAKALAKKHGFVE